MNNTSVLIEEMQSCTTVPIIRLDKLNFPHLSKDPKKHPGVLAPVIGWLIILLPLMPGVKVTYILPVSGLSTVFPRIIILEANLLMCNLVGKTLSYELLSSDPYA